MAHNLEMNEAGEAVSMVYVGKEKPWHGLGVQIPADLTPEQVLVKANLDWTVEKMPVFTEIAGERVELPRAALVRTSDNTVLDVISNDWEPCQNAEAFDFFNDFIAAGEMTMDTAGSLKDGRIVWALAKTNESFELFGGRDKVDGYIHFTNPHQYGKSIDVRTTSVRVVCDNTLTLSLGMKQKSVVKTSHRSTFNPEAVKLALGVSKDKLMKYKEMAEFLSNKRFANEDVVEYFKRVFPVANEAKREAGEVSRSAKKVQELLYTQPGAELGEGSFWAGFNAVTYMVDHVVGRSADTRLASAWYGSNRELKVKALEIAMEMAS